MSIERTPILIIGGGYAGLTAAALLSWRGVPCMVAERHPSTSLHPKAHGINRRSMELLRVVPGLENDLFNACRTEPNDSTVIISETVTGPALRTLITPGTLAGTPVSPAKVCAAGQDKVEPILLRHARALGADVRFNMMLTYFEQQEDGVEARLRNTITGGETKVIAEYLVAADGASSSIRDALGVKMHGPGVMALWLSILFEADLAALLPSKGFVLCYLRNEAFTGSFVSCDDPNRGQLNIALKADRDRAEDFDAARCEDLVRAALGVQRLDVKALEILPWEMTALVASTMQSGRVFIVGDAAHVMPPVGGLGGQTALQDAADIAWKLAFVVKGWAGRGLLDTYQTERLPVAHLALARQIANYVDRLEPERDDLRMPEREAEYLGTAIGYRYRSAAIVSDATDDGRSTECPLHPTGSPGTRLPHIELLQDGRTISTHDLCGRDFVLLAGPRGAAWIDAARHIARRAGAPLTCYQHSIDFLDSDDAFLASVGMGMDGALLVRPDGFIAWRARRMDEDPLRALDDAFARARCLAPAAPSVKERIDSAAATTRADRFAPQL